MLEYGYIPNGKLSQYVKFIWYNHGYQPPGSIERVLPVGSSQLIINLENRKFRHFEGTALKKGLEYDPVVLVGIHTQPVFLDSTTRISTMGVVLKPGAVTALFEIPAGEFSNRVVSLEAVTGSGYSELIEKLNEASSPEASCRILEVYLIRGLNASFEANPAVLFANKWITGRHGIQPVSEVLEKTGYSRRWFSEIFSDTVGITPKTYARVCRFQRSLQLIRKADTHNWADLSLACGYFDQAHFIHDFKNFSGISPAEYGKEKSAAVNHLPL